MKNAAAVCKKQARDTWKNKAVLIQFVMFPALAIFMEQAVRIPGMPEHFFINLFAAMYVGMAPMVAMSSIISEEKEKNTLRVLLMSNVKPWEYLAGIGISIWAMCMAGSVAFCLTGGYQARQAAAFLGIMAVGILPSLFLGAAIGAWSQTQMAAASITVPVMLVFSFLPMLSVFNRAVSKVARYTYSEQISILLRGVGDGKIGMGSLLIIGGNMLAALALFAIAYRKSGLA